MRDFVRRNSVNKVHILILNYHIGSEFEIEFLWFGFQSLSPDIFVKLQIFVKLRTGVLQIIPKIIC